MNAFFLEMILDIFPIWKKYTVTWKKKPGEKDVYA